MPSFKRAVATAFKVIGHRPFRFDLAGAGNQASEERHENGEGEGENISCCVVFQKISIICKLFYTIFIEKRHHPDQGPRAVAEG